MKNLNDKPFALVGVHVGGSSVKQTKELMVKETLTWRSFVDAGGAGAGPIATSWNLSAMPSFDVVDQKGVIRHLWAGAPGEKVIDAALDKLIKEAEEHAK